MSPIQCWPQEFGQPLALMVRRLHLRIVVLAHGLLQRRAQVHRLGERQVAGVGAGAGEHVFDLARAGVAEADLVERRVDLRQPGQRNEARAAGSARS